MKRNYAEQTDSGQTGVVNGEKFGEEEEEENEITEHLTLMRVIRSVLTLGRLE